MLVILALLQLVCFSQGQMEDTVVSNLSYAGFLNVKCLNYAPELSSLRRCGSSIVNQYLMLTAAHCVDPTTCDEIAIAVTVGFGNKSKGIDTAIHSYIMHEHYSPKLQADIALVRLMSPLELNAQVSRVALMADPPYEELGEIVGWDQHFSTRNGITNDFYYSTHYVWRNKDCMDVMDDLPNGTFCGSGNDIDKILSGYPGSALVVQGYIQIGICSYFEPRDNDTVFIFTDIGYYYEWIQDSADSIMFENQDKEKWQSQALGENITTNETEAIL